MFSHFSHYKVKRSALIGSWKATLPLKDQTGDGNLIFPKSLKPLDCCTKNEHNVFDTSIATLQENIIQGVSYAYRHSLQFSIQLQSNCSMHYHDLGKNKEQLFLVALDEFFFNGYLPSFLHKAIDAMIHLNQDETSLAKHVKVVHQSLAVAAF